MLNLNHLFEFEIFEQKFLFLCTKYVTVKKSILYVIGFSLFFIGIIGLILSMVGLRLSLLKYFDEFSLLAGFLMKILLIMAGLIIIYINHTKEIE